MPLLHLDADHDLVQSIKLAEQLMGRGSSAYACRDCLSRARGAPTWLRESNSAGSHGLFLNLGYNPGTTGRRRVMRGLLGSAEATR